MTAAPAAASDPASVQPRAHWVLLTSFLALAGTVLMLHGYASGALAPVPEAPVGAPAPDAARDGGPVVDGGTGQAAGANVPDRTVVLTFDDGPGPATPKVLDVLTRHHVPGTFFVVGEQMARDPALARRMVAAGHEVGLHTFTHADLTAAPGWRSRLELTQTQLVLAAATGRTSALLRLPFSGTPAELGESQWRTIAQADGYRVVLADLDPKDWDRPGVEEVVQRSTPAGDEGAVVLLHDGGGDRSQTVEALDRLIPQLRSNGYRFTTVNGAFDAPPATTAAAPGDRAAGWLIIAAVRAGGWLDRAMTIALVAAGALTLARTVALVLAARHHRRRERRPAVTQPATPWPSTPKVSVVVPAYNEELGIAATLSSLVGTGYPELDVVVVDDGSTDRTADVVRRLNLPDVRLLQQANAGKPAALNAGIAAARHDLLVLVDGDTVFEPGAIEALVAPLADRRVGAVSGTTKVGNRRRVLGAAHRVRHRLQPGPADVRRAGVHAHGARCDRGVPPGRDPAGRGSKR